MDYRDQRIARTLHAYMVTPTNLDDVRGEIIGVNWDSLDINAGYYTDTRVCASLTLINSNYVRGSFVRITVEIDGTEHELGTFAVDNDEEELTNSASNVTLNLISTLHTLSLDYAPDALVLGSGALVLEAIQNNLIAAGRSASDWIFTDANDYKMASTVVMESGVSYLSRAYELANQSGNRLDVDGHGRFTLTRYIAPNDKTPSFTLDMGDPRGVIQDGVTRQSNYGESISKAIVAYDYKTGSGDDEQEHHMFAVASNSRAQDRGFTVTDYTTVSELNPPTQSKLNELAQTKLTENSNDINEWTLTSKYIPGIWEGSVIELIASDQFGNYSGSRKCLVKSLDISGRYLDMTMTLKETSGGDSDD